MSAPFSRFSEYFLVVAKSGNLRKAADQLFISASAVHRQIALAEEELGVLLFERLPNGLKLTLAGELLYADLLRWQKEFKQTCVRFDEIQGLKRGSIEFGLIAALSEGFVIDALTSLQTEYPWLTFNIHTNGSDEIVEKIINTEIDFGLILDPILNAQLEVLSFIEIPLGFVMSPEHPLAKNKKLNLSDTIEYRHIIADRPLVIHERVMAIYKKQNFIPAFETSTNDIHLMISMLKRIMSYLDVYSAVKNQDLVFIQIVDRAVQPLTLALCAGSRRQLSRISKLLIQSLMQNMESIKADF